MMSRENENLVEICMEGICHYSQMLGKDTVLYRKDIEEKVPNDAVIYCIKMQVELMLEYLEKVFQKAVKKATAEKKSAIYFGSRTRDGFELKELAVAANGENLYRADAVIVILGAEKEEEAKDFFKREGVNFLLRGNNQLHWATI